VSDVFISYAHTTAREARAAAEALRASGFSVWIDDDLLAHRAFSREIDAQLTAAKAALVIWSADAAMSDWVLSEANRAREERKLVQFRLDGARLPMPFDQIHCADLSGWSGEGEHPSWAKVVASVADLVGGEVTSRTPIALLPLPTKPSIAVMPFANLSGDPEQDYFADGMVAEITTVLSRFRSIFVIASSSTLSFKGKSVGARDAGRQLGVSFVLEGSVRKFANQVRIAVQLIDAAAGRQMWADRFEEPLDDVFALQDKVALAVAGKIEPTIEAEEIRRASARPTDSLGSYDLWLRALPLLRRIDKTGLAKALNLLDRAIAIDPDYGLALAWAAICHVLIDLSDWGDAPDDNRRRGLERAQRALILAPDDALVVAGAGFVQGYLAKDMQAALSLTERAISLNPGHALACYFGGDLHRRAGDTDTAVKRIETAMRLDPLGPDRYAMLYGMALAQFAQGRFRESISTAKEAERLLDYNPMPPFLLAACYGHVGQGDDAARALRRYRELTTKSIDAFARWLLIDQGQLKLALEGIALAEGKGSAEGQGDTKK
jgi:TolB-like protein